MFGHWDGRLRYDVGRGRRRCLFLDRLNGFFLLHFAGERTVEDLPHSLASLFDTSPQVGHQRLGRYLRGGGRLVGDLAGKRHDRWSDRERRCRRDGALRDNRSYRRIGRRDWDAGGRRRARGRRSLLPGRLFGELFPQEVAHAAARTFAHISALATRDVERARGTHCGASYKAHEPEHSRLLDHTTRRIAVQNHADLESTSTA